MQPTGRDGPTLRAGAALPVAERWKRQFVWARASGLPLMRQSLGGLNMHLDKDSMMADCSRIFSLTLPVGLILQAGCGGSTCGAATASSDVCPPPRYGYAEVRGRALHQDGSPIVNKQAYVSCGPVVGAYDDITNEQGQFVAPLVYAVADTVLYRFPPRNTDGSFEVTCGVSLRLADDNVLREDSLAVRFGPTPEAMVPTTVELQESAP
jgi:hypothetical protein